MGRANFAESMNRCLFTSIIGFVSWILLGPRRCPVRMRELEYSCTQVSEYLCLMDIRDGLMVRASACHAGNPSSNLGHGIFFFFF